MIMGITKMIMMIILVAAIEMMTMILIILKVIGILETKLNGSLTKKK